MFKILVIDDDKNTRVFMRAVLEAEHYHLFTAENGVDALNILDNEHIDLVIVDIMMPLMDGYEFSKKIRSVNNNLPILMVSAKLLPEDRKLGYLSGIDDYMTKPVDEEELLLKIKALLRRAKIENEHKIVIGDVLIDYNSLTVSKGNEVIELPQKEFLLLYKLLSNPGKIFTRIQLMDEIWGVNTDTGWETLTVHIGRLRKKFENWNEFRIESIRGLGYKGIRNL